MNKIIKIFSIAVLLFFAGCSVIKPEKEIVYQEVKVPVYIYPDIKIDHIDKPELEIHKLSDSQKEILGILGQAYVISLKQMEEYALKLLKTIEEFNKN